MQNTDFTLHSRQAFVTLGAGGIRNGYLKVTKAINMTFGLRAEKR